MRYDAIVIGAGSAGCVLAARLSEDPGRSVLLLEAGPDYPLFEHLPDDLKLDNNMWLSAYGPHSWGYVATVTPQQTQLTIPRGKATGGSSAINGQVLYRGIPEDYDNWASWGNDEWSFLKVLPYFRRFGAQGGDWGASVTSYLGFAYPQHLIGIHVTSMTRPMPYLGPGSRALSAPEKTLLEQREAWLQAEGGYSHIQDTKPQTLSYGLNDSPAGLAAWIVEKYRTWSDCSGDVERRFTKDEILTTITLYWVTQTINASTRLYYETQRHPWTLQQGERVVVLSAMAVFPKEISRLPREWGERSFNVQRWTEMSRGGHFAALEEPGLLADEIRAFFRPLRD